MRAGEDQAALPSERGEKMSDERAPSEGPRSMRAVNDNLAAPHSSF